MLTPEKNSCIRNIFLTLAFTYIQSYGGLLSDDRKRATKTFSIMR